MPTIGDFLHSTIDGYVRRKLSVASERKDCQICGGPMTAYAVFGESPLLFACKPCGTQCLLPTPSMEELADYYNDYPTTRYSLEQVRALTAIARAGLQHRLRAASLPASALRGARFFDAAFGCGSSLFASAELGAEAHGVDLDPEAISRALQHAREFALDISVQVSSVESFGGSEQSFDFVRASHVLEHAAEPRAFLRGLHRLLRPGGVLLLECPNNRALFWLVKNALRHHTSRESFYNALKKTEHLWGFNRTSLGSLLAQEGFNVRSVRDYSVADPRYQPDVALWYLTWSQAVPASIRHRSSSPLLYAAVRTFDGLSSRLAHGGMGLSAVAIKA